jgi:hypothetical protein
VYFSQLLEAEEQRLLEPKSFQQVWAAYRDLTSKNRKEEAFGVVFEFLTLFRLLS